MPLNEVAAAGFGAGAADYERGRPGYPPDIVAWLATRLAIGAGTRVLDLAAGTGKFTRLLVPAGADIVAVEPVAAMRGKFAETCPGVPVLDGTAEAIPLADASVDSVIVAQAFHWFDAAAALREIARVLRPGGHLGLVFNERDVREPWVASLSRLIRWDERKRWRVPYTVEVDWAAVIADAGPEFKPATRQDSSFVQAMDPDLLVARVLSTSYIAVLPKAAQAELASQVRALADPLGPSFVLPYITHAYAARRR